MSKLQSIYQRLRENRDASIGRAMAAALPTADARATRLIALSLLERGDKAGCVRLIEHFDKLPKDIRKRVVSQAPDLAEVLERVARSTTGPGRSHALRIVVFKKMVGSAGLLANALTDPRSEVVDLAAEGLAELAGSQVVGGMRARGIGVDSRRDRRAMCRAVYDGIQRYDRHEREGVLRALCVLIGSAYIPPSFLLSCGSGAGMRDLKRLLSRADREEVRDSLVQLLSVPELRGSAVEGIIVGTGAGHWASVLGKTHLLLDPHTRTALQMIPDPHDVWPSEGVIGSFCERHVRGLVHWADGLPWLGRVRIEKLKQLSGVSDRWGRLAGLRRLMRIADAGALGAISEYCHDADPGIARIATRYLIRVGWEGLADLCRSLVNSEHLDVRQIAGEHLGPAGFKKLWTSWPRLGEQDRLTLGRALVKIDPRFHLHLAQKLGRRDSHNRLRATAIIRCLGQGDWFDRTLDQLCDQPDTRVASSAISALASAGSDLALKRLYRALESDDARVRANALEALGERGVRIDRGRLRAMAEHEANRPRANAIAMLMVSDPASGIEALGKMLADPSASQRRSALWVAGFTGATEMAPRIAEMVVSDPDRLVRAKAEVVAGKMIELMDKNTVETMAA